MHIRDIASCYAYQSWTCANNIILTYMYFNKYGSRSIPLKKLLCKLHVLDVHLNNDRLVYACKIGALDLVKYLVRRGANVMNYGHYQIDNISQIYDRYRINPRHIDSSWTCPIYATCIGGNLEIVIFLQKRGADFEIHDLCLIHEAFSHGNLRVVKFLLSTVSDRILFNDIVNVDCYKYGAHPHIIKFLARHKFIDTNTCNTYLNVYTENNNPYMVKFLTKTLRLIE